MWNKFYLILFAVLTLVMGVLIYLPYSWLQSITAPKDIQEKYLHFYNVSWTYLLISALVLLLFGNFILWKSRRAWAMWVSLAYFTVFTIAHKFWLDRAFFSFQQANNLTDSFFSFGALAGLLLIVMAAIIVFFDQYLVKRLHDKMYPAMLPPVETLSEESTIAEKKI